MRALLGVIVSTAVTAVHMASTYVSQDDATVPENSPGSGEEQVDTCPTGFKLLKFCSTEGVPVSERSCADGNFLESREPKRDPPTLKTPKQVSKISYSGRTSLEGPDTQHRRLLVPNRSLASGTRNLQYWSPSGCSQVSTLTRNGGPDNGPALKPNIYAASWGVGNFHVYLKGNCRGA